MYIHDDHSPVEFLPVCPELHTRVLVEDIAEGVRALTSAAFIERPTLEQRIRLGSGEDGVTVTFQVRSGDGKTVLSTHS